MIVLKKMKISNKYIHLSSSKHLVFNSGDIHFIKGKSGTGKTTLMYVLGLISSNKDYEYVYNNKLIKSSKDKETIKKNEIGFLYQNFNLLEDMNLYSCIEMFASMNNSAIDAKKACDLLNKFNLDLDLNRIFKTLSGGEKQRFCLACILAKDPNVIIADEPTSALDKENADNLMDILYKIAKEYNKTIIISTHTSEYDDMADTIYQIEDQMVKIIKNKDCEIQHSNMSSIKKVKTNFKFYWNLLKYQLGRLVKSYKYQLLLSMIIVSLGVFLVGYSQTSQQGYLDLLNESIKNESVLFTQLPLEHEDIELIQNIQGVVSVHPLYMSYGNLKTSLGKEYDIAIFPGSDETMVYLSSSFLSEKEKIVDINGKKYEVKGLISDYQSNLYCSEPQNFVAIIPSKDFNYTTAEFNNRYILTMDSIEQYDAIKERIELMYPGSDLNNTFSQIQSLLQGFESNKIYVYSAVIILNIVSFILLNLTQFYESRMRKKDLCIFQANGMTKTDLVIVECLRFFIIMIGYIAICTVSILLLNYIANYFLLENVQLVINSKCIKLLIIILIVDILLPMAIHVFFSIRSEIEDTLRSNFV